MKVSCSLILAAALFLDATKAQTLGPAPDNLAELCDEDTISSDLVAFLNCGNVCSVASCCGDTCADDVATCVGYSPCFILNTLEPTDPSAGGPVSTAPDNLAELCAADAVATDFLAYVGCLTACLPSTCCSGDCETDAECDGYGACGVFETIDEPPFDGIPLVPDDVGGDDGSSNAPLPPANLDEVCAEATISTDLIAYLRCVNVCLGASCCGGTCASDVATCSLYAPCGILETVESPEPSVDGPAVAPPANIAELCAADIAGDFDAYLGCLGACIGGSCCEEACSTDVTTCIQYTPCLALNAVNEPPFNFPVGGNITDDTGGDSTGENLPPPPDNLEALCDEDAISTDYIAYLNCGNVCSVASCCADTCSGDFAACLPYLACVSLDAVSVPLPDASGPIVAPPSNLAALCSPTEIVSSFGAYVGCLEACIPSGCCDDACSSEFAICIQYAPCLALQSIQEPPFDGLPPPEDEVTDAPVDPVTNAPVVAPTATPVVAPTPATTAPAPAPPEGTNDSGASSFGLLISLFFTMAVIVLSE
ncbi:MAG: hypothetical protein SGBAC_006822 [Bacillariaceae sp.]